MANCVLCVIFCSICMVIAEDHTSMWLTNFIPKDYSKTNPAVKVNAENLTEPTDLVCYIVPFVVTQMLMKEMELAVDTFILLYWHDDRLNMPGNQDIGDSDYALPPEIAGRLWKPVFYFTNCKGQDSSLIHQKTIVTLTHGFYGAQAPLQLRVMYRETFNFICRYAFYAYPIDRQECEMKLLLECTNKRNQVRLEIRNFLPNGTFKNISVPPAFRLQSFGEQDCIQGSYDESHHLCFRFVFVFRRIYTHHMMTLFIPSILIVTLSWISFWIEISASAPRVTLGLTSLLTLSTQFNNAQKDLPSVADVKAIDIWMFACMFMVFASLAEFAIANQTAATTKSKVVNVTCVPKYVTTIQHGMYKPSSKKRAFLSHFKITSKGRKKKPSRCLFCSSSTNRVDLIARFSFPGIFLMFNVVFWTYFLSIH